LGKFYESRQYKPRTKRVLKKGWQPFSNLIYFYGVKVDGNHYRKLKKMHNKVDISTASTPYWIVDACEFRSLFNIDESAPLMPGEIEGDGIDED